MRSPFKILLTYLPIFLVNTIQASSAQADPVSILPDHHIAAAVLASLNQQYPKATGILRDRQCSVSKLAGKILPKNFIDDWYFLASQTKDAHIALENDERRGAAGRGNILQRIDNLIALNAALYSEISASFAAESHNIQTLAAQIRRIMMANGRSVLGSLINKGINYYKIEDIGPKWREIERNTSALNNDLLLRLSKLAYLASRLHQTRNILAGGQSESDVIRKHRQAESDFASLQTSIAHLKSEIEEFVKNKQPNKK